MFLCWSGALDQSSYCNQNYGTDKSHNDGADQSACGPNPQGAEDPTAYDATENAEDDVHKHSVAAALHDDTGEPACNHSYDDPDDEPHSVLLNRFNRFLSPQNVNLSRNTTERPP